MRMMTTFFLILMTVMMVPGVVIGQHAGWENFTNGDNVRAIAIDGDDVWVGTYGGLVHYHQGTQQYTYYNKANSGLPDNLVQSIAIDASGTKWIGTWGGGMASFDGSDWTVYNTGNSGLPDDIIHSIAIDASGTKWIGTDEGGMANFDGSDWTVYNTGNSGLPDDIIHSIAIDASGTKWIGTDEGGMASFDGVDWNIYNTGNSGLPENNIHSIAIDGTDVKWIGTYEEGVASFDGSDWTLYNPGNSGQPGYYIHSIAIDGSGTKWFGTNQEGVVSYDGIDWNVYDRTNSGLPGYGVCSIAFDASGTKWFGTLEFGLATFDGADWQVYETANSGLPDNDVYSIVLDASGTKWIGTDGGMASFDGFDWNVYNTGNSALPDNDVYSIVLDASGTKWIGTNSGGMASFDGFDWNVYNTGNSGLPHDDVRSIAIDASGTKWIGTDSGGMASFDGFDWNVYNTGNSALPDNDVRSIAIDASGTKWIGTDSGGMASFDGFDWNVYNTGNSSLPDNSIKSIAVDASGTKWIGTWGGMASFDGLNWNVYDTANSGLPDDNVLSIAIDASGTKWIGTNNGGMASFDGSDWNVYNTDNSGLSLDEVETIAIDRYGIKWIGIEFGGMASFNTSPSNAPPTITDIPDQTIETGESFTEIQLDDYVSDADHADDELIWSYSGNTELTVEIINRVAIVTAPNGWKGAETITFRAADPAGAWDEDEAVFTVNPSDVRDLTIATTTLNSITIPGGSPEFTVYTNASLSGTCSLYYEHSQAESNVIPLAGTPNWGDRENDLWLIDGDISNGSTTVADISLTAPATPGIYYIIFAAHSQFTAQEVLSATSWHEPAVVWNDGNDLFDLTVQALEEARTQGTLVLQLLNNSAYEPSVFGVNAIKLEVTERPDDPDWEVYNLSNSGLPNNKVYSLAASSSGLLWAGTHGGGAASFDGSDWNVYDTGNSGLPDNYVESIAVDAANAIWLGTDGGLAHFDGSDWTTYTTANSGLPNNDARTVAIDDSDVKWVGTYNGLVSYDGIDWHLYNTGNSGLPANDIRFIDIDASDMKWIGTYGGGVASFDGTNWITYNTGNSGLPHNNIWSLIVDDAGACWIGTEGGGLACFDGRDWTVYNTSNSALPHNNVRAFAIDASGTKWIGTDGGLVTFNGREFTLYNTSNSELPGNMAWSLAIDGSDTRWIGTYENGLASCSAPLSDIPGDLISHYPFNDDLFDYSNYGRHAADNNVSPAPDRFGAPNSAYLFNGMNSSITAPDFHWTEMSMEFWVKVNDLSSNRYIMEKAIDDRNVGDEIELSLDVLQNGSLEYRIGAAGNHYSTLITDPYLIRLGRFHHIVITADRSGDMQVYVDQIKAGENTITGSLDLDGPVIFGNVIINAGQMDGIIDDIRIYNRVLNQAEINNHYAENSWNQTLSENLPIQDNFEDGVMDNALWRQAAGSGTLEENDGYLKLNYRSGNAPHAQARTLQDVWRDTMTVNVTINPVFIDTDRNMGFWLGNLETGNVTGYNCAFHSTGQMDFRVYRHHEDDYTGGVNLFNKEYNSAGEFEIDHLIKIVKIDTVYQFYADNTLVGADSSKQFQSPTLHFAPGLPWNDNRAGEYGEMWLDNFQVLPYVDLPAEIAFSQTSAAFQQTAVSDSDAVILTIENPGLSHLEITALTIEGEDAGDFQLAQPFSATVIPSKSERAYTLRFIPQSHGNKTAVLQVISSSDDSPHSITLTGTGNQASLSANPEAIAFENTVYLGQHETSHAYVQNKGNTAFVVSSAVLSGNDKDDFMLLSTHSNQTISPGDSIKVEVKFNPQSTGAKTADLSLKDGAGVAGLILPLTGTAAQLPLSYSREAIDFGNIPVNNASDEWLYLKNNGETVVRVDSSTLAGENISAFAIVSGSGSKKLNPADSMAIKIQCRPINNGNYEALLLVHIQNTDADTLPLTAFATNSSLSVTPGSLVFSDTYIGDSVIDTIQIKNIGNTSLTLQSVALTNPPEDSVFTVLNSPAEKTLAADATYNLRIKFKPSQVLNYAGMLRLFSNAVSSPDTVRLAGSGDMMTLTPDNPVPVLAQAMDLAVTLPANYTPTTQRIYYRQSGETAYKSKKLTSSGRKFSYEIPAGLMTERGLEYYFYFSDGHYIITYPQLSPQADPAVVEVPFDDKTYPLGIVENQYRMVSMPVVLDKPRMNQIFSDDYGRTDTETWRLLTYQPHDTVDYIEYPLILGNAAPGKAYWLITREAKSFTLGSGKSNNADSVTVLTLNSGWNQIASPYAFPIAWADVSKSDSIEAPVHYNGTDYEYNQTLLQPWDGYFVYNRSAASDCLCIPRKAASSSVSKSAAAEMLDLTHGLTFSAKAKGFDLKDIDIQIGTAEKACNGLDAFDQAKAPPVGHYVNLSIEADSVAWHQNFKSVSETGQYWDLKIATSLPGKHKLQIDFEESGLLQKEHDLYFMDLDYEYRIFPDHNRLTLLAAEGQVRRLRIITGTEDFALQAGDGISLMPLDYKLYQNYPNPFNPSTTIRYQMGKRLKARLVIYDILGREVRLLLNEIKPPGQHEIEWDGLSNTGLMLPSGLYIYTLKTDNQFISRKLIKIQ